jgi:hypothetical protein
MIQPGFFDLQDRLHKIDKNGDPLTRINETINWKVFRPALEKARDKGRTSNVGPKGYDVILLFKILILQSLYNLSDDTTEFQILDRHSFGRFLGLHNEGSDRGCEHRECSQAAEQPGGKRHGQGR